MKKISVIIANQHQTSITLEEEFFDALTFIAKQKSSTINKLVTEIDSTKDISNLSSAIRVYILKYFQEQSK